MAKLNIPTKSDLKTHEGAQAKRIDAKAQLLRSTLACMLWEDTFYEDGVSIAERIKESVGNVPAEFASEVAYRARTEFKLRHVPLWVTLAMAGNPLQRHVVARTLTDVIQRPDELSETLAMYWKDGKKPLSAQIKKGLAQAFTKFSAYQLAKYNSKDAAIKLRDVLFLTHPKPVDGAQAITWKQLVDGTLASPDTWEVALSAGADKKETFTRLIKERKLGALALLRNLRNMEQAGVDPAVIRQAISEMNVERVLPFRFLAAAKYAPRYEPQLEQAMFKCLEGVEKLPGKTALLVDNSGSMYGMRVSAKSELDRSEAACALAMLLREVCEDVDVIAFAGSPTLVPARRGFALRDAIRSTPRGGTYTETAKQYADSLGYDRIIIVTDEQSHESLSNPKGKGYVINVAAYKNGIGYGQWNHIDGWSEAVLDYIAQYEKQF